MEVKVLELFSGSGSVGKVARRLGMDVVSLDSHPYPGTTLVMDIRPFAMEPWRYLPQGWKPNIVWASPPCTTYSMAAVGKHRSEGGRPKSKEADMADKVLENTVNLLAMWSTSAMIYMENPMAMMRKMPMVTGRLSAVADRTTVWYCRYGDKAAKPTDIWTNNLRSLSNPSGWQPRPVCHNGNPNCHHDRAPRGSSTGTQGKANAHERGKIPSELILEILLASIHITPKTPSHG